MREKLIELIRNCISCEECRDADIADHLLANGVIVPPCKVGDTVYYIDTCRTAEDFGKKYINWGEVTGILVDAKTVSIKPNRMGYSFPTTWDRAFLTREEAEAALKEGQG